MQANVICICATILDITRNWVHKSSRLEDNSPESPTPVMCDIEDDPTPSYSWTSDLTDISTTESS